MEIKISSSNSDDYLLIKSIAFLRNENDLLNHATKIYEEVLKFDNKKILLDNTETHFPSDLFQYYNLVQHYITNFSDDVRFLKIACVISADYIKQGKFWETVADNQGYECAIFTDFQHAINWLK